MCCYLLLSLWCVVVRLTEALLMCREAFSGVEGECCSVLAVIAGDSLKASLMPSTSTSLYMCYASLLNKISSDDLITAMLEPALLLIGQSPFSLPLPDVQCSHLPLP